MIRKEVTEIRLTRDTIRPDNWRVDYDDHTVGGQTFGSLQGALASIKRMMAVEIEPRASETVS